MLPVCPSRVEPKRKFSAKAAPADFGRKAVRSPVGHGRVARCLERRDQVPVGMEEVRSAEVSPVLGTGRSMRRNCSLDPEVPQERDAV